jgi:hypothetical protein
MNQNFTLKLRNPDDDFLNYLRMLGMIVPISFGGFSACAFILVLLVNGLLCSNSSVAIVVTFIAKIAQYIMFGLFLVSYITLKILYVYVSVQLKKKRLLKS